MKHCQYIFEEENVTHIEIFQQRGVDSALDGHFYQKYQVKVASGWSDILPLITAVFMLVNLWSNDRRLKNFRFCGVLLGHEFMIGNC